METIKCPQNSNVAKQPVLLTILISALLPSFMGSSIIVALPSIGNEYGMTAAAVSWVSIAYLLAVAIFLVPFGRVADIFGRKRIYLWGIITLSVTSMLCVFSETGLQLIILRVLQGLGSCMLASTGIAILASVYPAGERGPALGLVGFAYYAGMSAGPLLGGFLTQYFGWRSIFWVSTLLGVINVVIVLKYLKAEWAEAKGERLDIGGAVIYCFSLAALLCGFTFLHTSYGWLLLFTGAAGLIGFGRWVSTVTNPIVDIFLFKGNKSFIFSTFAALINYGIAVVVGYLLSLYLQFITGLSPQYAGVVLTIQPILQAIFSPFAGRISDRIEPGRVSSLGMALNGAGLFLLVFLGEHTPLFIIILILILQGLGCAFFVSPNQNLVMNSVEKRSYGVAYGILATMRFIGQMLSLAIATLSFILYIGNQAITPNVYPHFLVSIHTTFIIMTILCAFGIYASLVKKQVNSKQH